MIILVTGPNGSGKSAFAEKTILRLSAGKPYNDAVSWADAGGGSAPGTMAPNAAPNAAAACALYYIATMIPYGDEGRARVEKHRKQRAPAGFTTVEEPFRVSGIKLPANAAVLLEDVTNLLANNIFGDAGRGVKSGANAADGGALHAVYGDIADMCAKCAEAVLVTIDGLTPSEDYDAGTRAYVEDVNRLNNMLAELADAVVKMENGVPVFSKGYFNAPA